MKSTRFLVIALIAVAGIVASTIMIATTKVNINGPWDDQATLRLIALVFSMASMMALTASAYFAGVGKEAELGRLKVGEIYKLEGAFNGSERNLVVICHLASGVRRIFDSCLEDGKGAGLTNVNNGDEFVWTKQRAYVDGKYHQMYEAKVVQEPMKRLRGSGRETPATSDASYGG